MNIVLPELSLVVLIGTSGSGKSTFAKAHFKPTEILSSDHYRAIVGDDENDQSVTPAAFELLHATAAKRLELGRLTVIDATNVQPESRKSYIDMARRHHVIPIAIVFDVPVQTCIERNQTRIERQVPSRVVKNQADNFRRSIKRLDDEGFRTVYTLSKQEEITAASIVREPLRSNKKFEKGPFDIIGDVHGCLEELKELLTNLGYGLTEVNDPDGRPTYDIVPPAGRKLLLVGDLVDRGPDTPGVIRIVKRAIEAGVAYCVRGNHDDKLYRKLNGRDVSITHGLDRSLEQISREPAEFAITARDFLASLQTHYVFDDGKLVIAHAGLKEHMHGRVSERVRSFCLFGDTTGEVDEFGLPIRLNWASDYRGKAMVVYGHTPTHRADWLNNTICLDTGCVYGNALTALRYPEREIVTVPAKKEYSVSKKPIVPPKPVEIPTQTAADDILDLADVTGKRMINTRLMNNILIREGNSAAALEIVSRFAVDPRWLIYLPPTMAPVATSKKENFLEYPREAFDYFASEGIKKVVCEQKHMGSRAIVVVCQNAEVAKKRFGVDDDGRFGVVYTRTGRPFFDDSTYETELLETLRNAIFAAGWWDKFKTDWFCFDGELMPWSAKAVELLRRQYAPTGSAGRAAMSEAKAVFPNFFNDELAGLYSHVQARSEAIGRFIESYGRYCWTVNSPMDIRYAPFHIMASEGTVHIDRDHLWHMTQLRDLAALGMPILMETPHLVVELEDREAVDEACLWWEQFTEAGVEGMVVKPLDWINKAKKGIVQPAVKVRGREYLRIIYGPEYTLKENLTRLKERHLGLKQSLALREFCLGIESLERFTRKEPLRNVHECAFGVLALESEPVDPRL